MTSSNGTARNRGSHSIKTVVTRYRVNLEQGHYAASTINVRLAAVRRLAYEAADAGLLSADLAAGIRRVKGAKKHGVRLGNWLTSEQGKRLLAVFDRSTVRSKRDYAMGAVLLGCGLRRAELANVTLEHPNIFKNERNTGFLLILSAREVTSGRYRYPDGSRMVCKRGSRRRSSARERFFGR